MGKRERERKRSVCRIVVVKYFGIPRRLEDIIKMKCVD
jgi:hypothetical protein